MFIRRMLYLVLETSPTRNSGGIIDQSVHVRSVSKIFEIADNIDYRLVRRHTIFRHDSEPTTFRVLYREPIQPCRQGGR